MNKASRMKYIYTVLLVIAFSISLKAQYYKNIQGQPFSSEVLDSELYSTDEKKTSLNVVLDSLKGNIVLIDFWASWCKTCHREMPYLKKLQKSYENEKIEYLFLSTDTEYKKWIRGLANINMKGHHYRIDVASKKDIQDYLKIRGIPFYVILDKSGNIYDPKAKWPHSEKLKNTIDLLIKLGI